MQKLEELEREHKPAFLDALTASTTTSSALTDIKVEEMDKRVRELISGEALTAKRQLAAEGRCAVLYHDRSSQLH